MDVLRRISLVEAARKGAGRPWWIWLAIVSLLLGACGGSGAGVREGIGEGQRAPGFQLESLDGGQVSLRDMRGQVVLINFWASWCDPCRAEFPDIQAVYEARKDEGFTVLGVNSHETWGAIEPFVEAMGVSFPILLDESGRVAKTYRLVGLPMSVLVDQEGIIQVRHLGLLTEDKLDEYLAGLLP